MRRHFDINFNGVQIRLLAHDATVTTDDRDSARMLLRVRKDGTVVKVTER